MIKSSKAQTPYIPSPFDLLFNKNKVNDRAVNRQVFIRFVKDLSTLINASVPLVKSLEVLAKQQKNKNFCLILQNIAFSVHSGLSFSLSIMKYPKIFDKLFISMIKSGESSCKLGEILGQIAKQKDQELKLQRKMRSIMIYPFIVISISVIIVSLLFLFIIPKFETVFISTFRDVDLPFTTHIIISLSHLFQEVFVSLSIVLVVLFFIFRFLKYEFRDKLILMIPVLGGIIRDSNIALFSRVFGTLLSNGISFMEALSISENVIMNSIISDNIRKVHIQIESGEPLSSVLNHNKYFSEMTIGMIYVGEETGTLANMFIEIANKLEDDVKQALESLTAILEPLMTLLLALIIGSIVIALFLPIISIMSNIALY